MKLLIFQIDEGFMEWEATEPPAGGSQLVATPTIPVTNPVVGLVRLKPSLTEVYLGPSGYKEVCNYVFEVAGTVQ